MKILEPGENCPEEEPHWHKSESRWYKRHTGRGADRYKTVAVAYHNPKVDGFVTTLTFEVRSPKHEMFIRDPNPTYQRAKGAPGVRLYPGAPLAEFGVVQKLLQQGNGNGQRGLRAGGASDDQGVEESS